MAGQYLLTVSDVMLEDTGTYTCMDAHGNGHDAHAELTVLGGRFELDFVVVLNLIKLLKL